MFESYRRPNPRQLVAFALLLAATAVVAHAKTTPREAFLPPTHAQVTGPRIEVAFVLDTTGSMSGLIEGAKQKIWSIANEMASGQPTPEIRVGLIGYRDRGDQYVTRFLDLTDDLDAMYAELSAFRANGGGDTPESVNQALHEAVTRMSWSRGSQVYKVVFLVGDAPPHMDYPNDVPYSKTARLAKDADIVINTIQCGSLAATTPVWQEIALAGAGQYAAIAQSGAMLAFTTPVDDELARLNRELAGTVVAYGDAEARAVVRGKLERSVSAPAPTVASRLAYMQKMGGRIASGASDLVDAVKEGLVDASKLASKDLPAEMREMDADERAAYVETKIAEREEIQRQVAELNDQREDYVRAAKKRLVAEGKGDSFDLKVLDTIREQAAGKGIRYE